MYFEEFEAGQRVVTAGRTVTEADVVAFAGISGDFNQIHTDSQLASGTPFGQRIAHGLLVTAIASGLTVQTGIIEGTVIAFREITDWKFVKPVFFGDTVHVEAEVIETKPFRRLGGGMVAIELNVKNQADETVIKGTWTFLVASKPE
jgi:acyl dehydratase